MMQHVVNESLSNKEENINRFLFPLSTLSGLDLIVAFGTACEIYSTIPLKDNGDKAKRSHPTFSLFER